MPCFFCCEIGVKNFVHRSGATPLPQVDDRSPFPDGARVLIGTLLASWMSTTGAAMLLIRPLMRAIWDAKWALLVPVIVLGGGRVGMSVAQALGQRSIDYRVVMMIDGVSLMPAATRMSRSAALPWMMRVSPGFSARAYSMMTPA